MKLQSICFCSAVVLAASVALGAGNYQRTKDGKAIVWNGEPKPGDTVRWFGGRDKDGYANGTGTLIWYTGDGQLYARYHGRMVRGKLDGPIDVQSHRKTAHATFANGTRTTRWMPGPASAASSSEQEQTQIAEAEQSHAAPVPSASPQATAAAPNAASAQTPAQSSATVAKEETAQQQTSDAEERQVEQTSSPEKPSERPLPLPDIPAEGPAIENRSPESPDQSVASASPSSDRIEMEQPTPITKPTITIEDKPEVADLSGPPPSLRFNSESETLPAAPEASTASEPAKPQLTPQEAISLGDSGAEAHGYDLAAYERPKADYSQVLGKWSLFYNVRQADADSDRPAHFTVMVDDASKEVEVRQ